MNFVDWSAMVPAEITGDSLWRMEAYRLARFAAEIGYLDATKLARNRLMLSSAEQLLRAVGSISANLAEGYPRGTGRDRARFYEHALGSARECRDWYYKVRHELGEDVAAHRLELLTQIIRLLLTMVPQQRQRPIRENDADYTADSKPISG